MVIGVGGGFHAGQLVEYQGIDLIAQGVVGSAVKLGELLPNAFKL